MEKLTKTQKMVLRINDRTNYNTYQCEQHRVYQIRKDIPENEQVCPFCNKINPMLSEEEIQQLINK